MLLAQSLLRLHCGGDKPKGLDEMANKKTKIRIGALVMYHCPDRKKWVGPCKVMRRTMVEGVRNSYWYTVADVAGKTVVYDEGHIKLVGRRQAKQWAKQKAAYAVSMREGKETPTPTARPIRVTPGKLVTWDAAELTAVGYATQVEDHKAEIEFTDRSTEWWSLEQLSLATREQTIYWSGIVDGRSAAQSKGPYVILSDAAGEGELELEHFGDGTINSFESIAAAVEYLRQDACAAKDLDTRAHECGDGGWKYVIARLEREVIVHYRTSITVEVEEKAAAGT